jgi:hypothetical protein
MATVTQHPRFAQILEQRCFFLFLALLALLIALPFLGETVYGRGLVGLLNLIILVTAVVAVESSPAQ